MKIDMHFHSLNSDGLLSEDELLNIANEKQLDFIALTDHDTVSNGFKQKAKEYWIDSCQSVEISARNYKHNKSLHITYYTNHINKRIKEILLNTTDSKKQLIKEQINHLINKWFDIDIEDFYSYYLYEWRKSDTLNKYDIAEYLYKSDKTKEIVLSLADNELYFYKSYLKEEWKFYNEYWYKLQDYEPSIEEVSSFVKEFSWILSLAHPNFTFKKWISEFEEVLPYYIKNWWINAIEINTMATRDWIYAILRAKDKYSLYLTFWSDFHKFTQDNKHAELWDLNPYINSDLIKKSFDEYKHILI